MLVKMANAESRSLACHRPHANTSNAPNENRSAAGDSEVAEGEIEEHLAFADQAMHALDELCADFSTEGWTMSVRQKAAALSITQDDLESELSFRSKVQRLKQEVTRIHTCSPASLQEKDEEKLEVRSVQDLEVPES